MNIIELIELLLLRHKGALDPAVFRMFDANDVSAVYLELILGWYLAEETSPPDTATSRYVLDSRVVLTPKGRRRLMELETMVPPTMREALGARPRRNRSGGRDKKE
jgi:hypothetical protein